MERRVDNNKAIWLGAVAGLALVGTLYWFIRHQDGVPAVTAPPPTEDAPAEPVPEDTTPQASYPVPEPAPQATPLPDLEGSDDAVRASLADAVGKAPVEAFLLPTNVVQRIVIFVDNLDRAALPLRFWPVAHTKGGGFAAESSGDTITIAAKNPARYEPFIAALEAADAKKVVAVYFRYYPLFQETYRQVGYPDRQFNDRLVAIVDHLLETPSVAEPVALVRPKVLYQFADPELEKLSWGQKTLIRMGPANAARVKARLEVYRAALTTKP